MVVDDIVFDPEDHTYCAKGRQLSGITGITAWRCGMHFPVRGSDKVPDFLADACEHGTDVHDAVSRALLTRVFPSRREDEARWVVRHMLGMYGRNTEFKSEWLVSDLANLASCIDIAVPLGDGQYDIYDIKTGKYHMDYCSLQLGFYKWMLKVSRGFGVRSCGVIASGDRMVYPVIPADEGYVQDTVRKYFMIPWHRMPGGNV
jgi:hypothetical protein